MSFRYRYVRYGPIFFNARGLRTSLKPGLESSDYDSLFENELAVDVGGFCQRLNQTVEYGPSEGEQNKSILDHHFEGAEFPSAAAAVLHQAELIWQKFRPFLENGTDIWLVTHNQPDFDALCAMYLARRILESGEAADEIPHAGWQKFGISPDRWLSNPVRDRIDWFNPGLGVFRAEPNRIWPVLLAAYASCVDNGKRIGCAKERALHSVLYAAMARGRDYLSEISGATEFFREVERNLLQGHLNPLCDSVLEASVTFAPERLLLEREPERYAADLKRGRRAIVNIRKASDPFQKWYEAAVSKPLIADTDSPSVSTADPNHLAANGQLSEQVDGIYLRDPECLLFKEWARLDRDNSSTGQGFLFTAIAYSGERNASLINKSNYFFSLDPERAGSRGMHLYNVWERLQIEEVHCLMKLSSAEATTLESSHSDQSAICEKERSPARPGFKERAGVLSNYFNDPWFDGANYQCTIVATPNQGTVIGQSGAMSDLTDDPVASLIWQELELSFYGQDAVVIRDLSTSTDQAKREHKRAVSFIEEIPAADPGYIRFATTTLRESVDPFLPELAEQVGRLLWRILHPQGGNGVPSDFLSRHLLVNNQWIGVWSRRGAAIASKSSSKVAEKFAAMFEGFVELTRGVETLSQTPPTGSASAQVISKSEELMRRLALLRHELALPENQLPARYFEATRLGEFLAMLRDIHGSAVEKIEREEARKRESDMAKNIHTMAHLQTIVEWIEIFIVSVYAAELCERIVAKDDSHPWEYSTLLVAAAAALGAAVTAALVLPTWLKKSLVVLIAASAFVVAIPFAHPGPLNWGQLWRDFSHRIMASPKESMLSGIAFMIMLVLVLILKLLGKRPTGHH